MIGNDGGGGEEMVRSSGGRSFRRRGASMRLELTKLCVDSRYDEIHVGLLRV